MTEIDRFVFILRFLAILRDRNFQPSNKFRDRFRPHRLFVVRPAKSSDQLLHRSFRGFISIWQKPRPTGAFAGCGDPEDPAELTFERQLNGCSDTL